MKFKTFRALRVGLAMALLYLLASSLARPVRTSSTNFLRRDVGDVR